MLLVATRSLETGFRTFYKSIFALVRFLSAMLHRIGYDLCLEYNPGKCNFHCGSPSFRVPVATPLVGVPVGLTIHSNGRDTHKGRRY